MIEEFPTISEAKVALMRVDALTGHVLDQEYKIAISVSQIVYTVFETYDEAHQYIKNNIEKRNTIEALIYDHNENILCLFNPFNAPPYQLTLT